MKMAHMLQDLIHNKERLFFSAGLFHMHPYKLLMELMDTVYKLEVVRA